MWANTSLLSQYTGASGRWFVLSSMSVKHLALTPRSRCWPDNGWWGWAIHFPPKIWQQQIPILLQRGQTQRILVGRNYWSGFLLAYSWILDKTYWGLCPNFPIIACQPVSEWVQCDLEDPGLFSLLKNSIGFFALEHDAANHSCKTKVPVKPQLVCLFKGSGFCALTRTASHKSQPKTTKKEVIQFASQ